MRKCIGLLIWGIGMALIVRPDKTEKIINELSQTNFPSYLIGRVVKGKQRCLAPLFPFLKEKELMINIGVLASGRGTNLQAIIEAIEGGKIEGRINIVISDNRDAFALKRAKQNNIETQYVDFKSFKNREDYDKEIIKILEEKKIDLVVLAGYMRIISPYFIKMYKNKSH